MFSNKNNRLSTINKPSKLLKSIFIISAVIKITLLAGCSMFSQNNFDSNYTELDYNPLNYKVAQPTKSIDIPKYIASNINEQPFYKIALEQKLNGKLMVSKLPPTITRNITEFD